MEKNLHTRQLTKDISDWIKDYSNKNSIKSLIVGISGGVDSALVSTLCAMTNIPTYVVSMPIKQKEDQLFRAHAHIEWLRENFSNVIPVEINLTRLFEIFEMTTSGTSRINGYTGESFNSELGYANSRSRLRMTTLYQIASDRNGIVVGTGNKVEDFGVGFFTKYGDGGVDISPIADLTKTEVRSVAKDLGIVSSIIEAKPTDGLWEDDRSDEDQIGATYEELEWAMENVDESNLNHRQSEVIKIFKELNTKNLHKMVEIPVYKKKK